MRAPTSPPIGAKTKMPLFARLTRRCGLQVGRSAAWRSGREGSGSGHDRPAERLTAVGRGDERTGEHPPIEPIARVRVVITYDLQAGEGTDPGADEHVARPMAVVVHPRDAGECGAAVQRRPNDPASVRPPARRLARHRGRGGERRRRVARGEGAVAVLAPEPAEELVAVRITRAYGRTLPPDGTLEDEGGELADDERL